MEFVQVRLRTNLDWSVPYVDRSRAAHVVIRLLRGGSAVVRTEGIFSLRGESAVDRMEGIFLPSTEGEWDFLWRIRLSVEDLPIAGVGGCSLTVLLAFPVLCYSSVVVSVASVSVLGSAFSGLSFAQSYQVSILEMDFFGRVTVESPRSRVTSPFSSRDTRSPS